MATIRDIAKVLDLSRQTVSQVLRNPSHNSYSPVTRQRVLAAAKELNYVPNVLARELAQGKTHVLSMVVPWNTPELMDTAQRSAKQLGYGMMVQFTPTPDPVLEADELMIAVERRVDGIIWMPVVTNPSPARSKALAQMRGMGVRLVLLETWAPELAETDTVRFDYGGGARQAVEHLRSQGYQQIIAVSHLRHDPHDDRDERFLEACRDFGMKGQLVYAEPVQCPTEAIIPILNNAQGPVAFYCDTDMFALDVLAIVKKLGKSVPDDVGIVAVGDLRIGNRYCTGELSHPPLTAVPRPFRAMAERAIDLIVQETPSDGPQNIKIPMSLIERESTRRLR
ncbi:MAG: LacI family DNA-binding transcriptional regulator [Sedimentisphaerales bacterium]|nr:LacI family DNA-binding transcriptional regulator [Sedimentisphaerales bacterium]